MEILDRIPAESGSAGSPLSRQADARPVSRRAHVAQVAFASDVAIPGHVAVEHLHEFVHGDAVPAPPLEELDLEPAEEPFGARVVRRTPFARHRADEPVLGADGDPSGPSVVPSAVRMHPRAVAFAKLRARLAQRGVR